MIPEMLSVLMCCWRTGHFDDGAMMVLERSPDCTHTRRVFTADSTVCPCPSTELTEDLPSWSFGLRRGAGGGVAYSERGSYLVLCTLLPPVEWPFVDLYVHAHCQHCCSPVLHIFTQHHLTWMPLEPSIVI